VPPLLLDVELEPEVPPLLLDVELELEPDPVPPLLLPELA